MEFREVVVWIGLLAIGLILWDGFRRMKANKRKQATRAELEDDNYKDPDELIKEAVLSRELPNGGARIRPMTDAEHAELRSRLNLRERVPMLMERVDVQKDDPDQDEPDIDLSQSQLDFNSAMSEHRDEVEDDVEWDIPEYEEEDDLSAVRVVPSAVEDSVDSFEEELNIPQPQDPEPVEFEEPEASQTPLQETVVAEAPSESKDSTEPVEDLVIIHVMAKNEGELSGSQVLELLLTAGLRHGPMDIFHYRNPEGYTEFSLANCVQPGTFNPDSMNQVNTPGVTLFLQLPSSADLIESFNHMYEMARYLAANLDAEVLDEGHSTVTQQRLEYYREKLRAYSRQRLIRT